MVKLHSDTHFMWRVGGDYCGHELSHAFVVDLSVPKLKTQESLLNGAIKIAFEFRRRWMFLAFTLILTGFIPVLCDTQFRVCARHT